MRTKPWMTMRSCRWLSEKVGILHIHLPKTLKPVFIVWAEHADAISKAYSGTGALKTDFTRTGKRTKKGALDDIYKSAVRYLKNNFFDGARQDGFDIVTGTWTPEHGTAGFLISDDRPLILRAVSRSTI